MAPSRVGAVDAVHGGFEEAAVAGFAIAESGLGALAVGDIHDAAADEAPGAERDRGEEDFTRNVLALRISVSPFEVEGFTFQRPLGIGVSCLDGRAAVRLFFGA